MSRQAKPSQATARTQYELCFMQGPIFPSLHFNPTATATATGERQQQQAKSFRVGLALRSEGSRVFFGLRGLCIGMVGWVVMPWWLLCFGGVCSGKEGARVGGWYLSAGCSRRGYR